MAEKKNLPTIKEIHSGDLSGAKDQSKLNQLLNNPPEQKWIKDHPIAKGVKYIPIERIEYLLTAVFLKWWIEVQEFKLIANSVSVHVRLFYIDPINGVPMHQDGLGAAPLQTDKDAGAIEFDHIKNDAVMKALPAAESYAIKDAAEKIGKLFGKDLNRADQILYDSLGSKFDPDPLDKVKQELKEALNMYQGEDKQDLQNECADRIKSGTFDQGVVDYVYSKIGGKS